MGSFSVKHIASQGRSRRYCEYDKEGHMWFTMKRIGLQHPSETKMKRSHPQLWDIDHYGRVLGSDVDVVVPAALENAIDENVAQTIKLN